VGRITGIRGLVCCLGRSDLYCMVVSAESFKGRAVKGFAVVRMGYAYKEFRTFLKRLAV
jgi:hypothetical protein